MSEASLKGIVAPNFRTPRLIGIFSVVFASELMIVGICLGSYAALMPMFGKFMKGAQQQVEAQARAQNEAALNLAREQEKKAKTEEERLEAAVKIREIEARPKNPMGSMMAVNQVQMGDPTFVAFTWTDVATGLILNALMLASGIGLMHWRSWARGLAVWTAALKILRLVFLYGFFIVAIVPPYAKRLGDAVEQMMGSMQTMGVPGNPAMTANSFYAKMYTVMYSAMGLGTMLVGVIFPAIVLWCLTRPAVRSACSGRLKLPKEPGQPW